MTKDKKKTVNVIICQCDVSRFGFLVSSLRLFRAIAVFVYLEFFLTTWLSFIGFVTVFHRDLAYVIGLLPTIFVDLACFMDS